MELIDRINRAERICEALLANIEGRASQVDSSYSIADRSISKMSLEEMTTQYEWWDRHLQKLIGKKEAMDAIANGKRGNRNILARFT